MIVEAHLHFGNITFFTATNFIGILKYFMPMNF